MTSTFGARPCSRADGRRRSGARPSRRRPQVVQARPRRARRSPTRQATRSPRNPRRATRAPGSATTMGDPRAAPRRSDASSRSPGRTPPRTAVARRRRSRVRSQRVPGSLSGERRASRPRDGRVVVGRLRRGASTSMPHARRRSEAKSSSSASNRPDLISGARAPRARGAQRRAAVGDFERGDVRVEARRGASPQPRTPRTRDTLVARAWSRRRPARRAIGVRRRIRLHDHVRGHPGTAFMRRRISSAPRTAAPVDAPGGEPLRAPPCSSRHRVLALHEELEVVHGLAHAAWLRRRRDLPRDSLGELLALRAPPRAVGLRRHRRTSRRPGRWRRRAAGRVVAPAAEAGGREGAWHILPGDEGTPRRAAAPHRTRARRPAFASGSGPLHPSRGRPRHCRRLRRSRHDRRSHPRRPRLRPRTDRRILLPTRELTSRSVCSLPFLRGRMPRCVSPFLAAVALLRRGDFGRKKGRFLQLAHGHRARPTAPTRIREKDTSRDVPSGLSVVRARRSEAQAGGERRHRPRQGLLRQSSRSRGVRCPKSGHLFLCGSTRERQLSGSVSIAPEVPLPRARSFRRHLHFTRSRARSRASNTHTHPAPSSAVPGPHQPLEVPSDTRHATINRAPSQPSPGFRGRSRRRARARALARARRALRALRRV